jgi:uncharacterized membrane protein YjdF
MNKTMKAFVAAIVLMGIVRFILNAAGLPNQIVKYFSMTAVIFVGSIYFAIATATHKERLKAAYCLILPYMVIEVIALSYTWVTGAPTIFHAAQYSFGVSVPLHTIGHFVGGLTWEPLSIFLLMELVWLIYKGGRRIRGTEEHAKA